MAAIFGAANTDSADVASHLQANVPGFIFMGWFYPTTLTSNNAYWGTSSLGNILIAPTTSEIEVDIDRTSDAAWTTSGAAITVDEWHFIAIVKSSTGGTPGLRVFIGHGMNAPQEVTIAVTIAGSGAEVASSSSIVGNAGTATTIAFQGEIGQVVDARFTPTILTALACQTVGTITQAEADYFLQTVVIPHWKGEPQNYLWRNTTQGAYLFDLEAWNPQLWVVQLGATQRFNQELTGSGFTNSGRRQPMRPLQAYPQRAAQYVRR